MDDTTEDSVLAIQVRGRIVTNEEWGPIGVWTSIGHWQKASMSVWHPDLLIRKLSSIDALSLCTVVVDNDFTTLHHEAWDDSLEDTCPIVQVPA